MKDEEIWKLHGALAKTKLLRLFFFLIFFWRGGGQGVCGGGGWDNRNYNRMKHYAGGEILIAVIRNSEIVYHTS